MLLHINYVIVSLDYESRFLLVVAVHLVPLIDSGCVALSTVEVSLNGIALLTASFAGQLLTTILWGMG